MCDSGLTWTLDTNVLVNANAEVDVARPLLDAIAERPLDRWRLSAKVLQEYIDRGGITQNPPYPDPVLVQGAQNRTKYCDEWFSTLESLGRWDLVRRVCAIDAREEKKLKKGGFDDNGDFPFLALARTPPSTPLVTQESDYNSKTVKLIRRVLGLDCLGYQAALTACLSR